VADRLQPARVPEQNGKPLKYRDAKGPSEIIATPVIVGGRVYIPIGQDPEHGTGAGALSCITVEAQAGGKLVPSVVWQNKEVGRSMSTPAVAGGLVYVPELAGIVHCVDAATGKSVWRHDAESNVWGSVLVADGKAYVGNESGELLVPGGRPGEADGHPQAARRRAARSSRPRSRPTGCCTWRPARTCTRLKK
jgi:hypothetical protein